MYNDKDKHHSSGGAAEFLGVDGVLQSSKSCVSKSCCIVGGVADPCMAGGCLKVTSFWAGAWSCTATQSCATTSSGKVKMLIQLQALLQLF